jgi:hypothetical protein
VAVQRGQVRFVCRQLAALRHLATLKLEFAIVPGKRRDRRADRDRELANEADASAFEWRLSAATRLRLVFRKPNRRPPGQQHRLFAGLAVVAPRLERYRSEYVPLAVGLGVLRRSPILVRCAIDDARDEHALEAQFAEFVTAMTADTMTETTATAKTTTPAPSALRGLTIGAAPRIRAGTLADTVAALWPHLTWLCVETACENAQAIVAGVARILAHCRRLERLDLPDAHGQVPGARQHGAACRGAVASDASHTDASHTDERDDGDGGGGNGDDDEDGDDDDEVGAQDGGERDRGDDEPEEEEKKKGNGDAIAIDAPSLRRLRLPRATAGFWRALVAPKLETLPEIGTLDTDVTDLLRLCARLSPPAVGRESRVSVPALRFDRGARLRQRRCKGDVHDGNDHDGDSRDGTSRDGNDHDGNDHDGDSRDGTSRDGTSRDDGEKEETLPVKNAPYVYIDLACELDRVRPLMRALVSWFPTPPAPTIRRLHFSGTRPHLLAAIGSLTAFGHAYAGEVIFQTVASSDQFPWQRGTDDTGAVTRRDAVAAYHIAHPGAAISVCPYFY